MKIAFIVEDFPTLSETFILNQITGLIDLGHEVEIFAQTNPKQEKVQQDVEEYNLMKKTYYIPNNKIIRFFKALLLIAKNIYKNPIAIIKTLNFIKYGKDALSLRILYLAIPFLNKDFDIIHCHFGPNGNVGALLKDLGINGILITTFHAYDITSYIKRESPHIYDNLFKKGDIFMAVCEDGKRKLKNLGCKEDKIVVHHMGVDIERFRLKERYFNGFSVKVLTVGRLVEKKGLIYAIKAVSLLIKKGHNIMYIIAGNGPLKSELYNLILQLGMSGKIKLIGSVDQSRVKAIMMNSDIFLLPSVTGSDGDQEGIPVVLMEAMSTGMPVISTYHSGIPEIVEDGKSGFLVPERDINALAGRLEYLIKHPELCSEMGRVGRDFVEKHYNIKKLNKQLVQFYEGVLSKTS